MTLHAALAAAATLVSLAFALSTLDRWLDRRRRHEAAWTAALLMFSIASGALWVGAALGWDELSFKVFYLFGAILNVPFLALGTVYLLGGEQRGDRWAAVVSLLGAFSAGLIVEAPVVAPIPPDELPRGSEVFGAGPRIAAAIGSGVAALVIIGGALLSAWRLLRTGRRSSAPQLPPSPVSPRRLALANLLIAAGTLVLSAGGLLNSVMDEMDAFALSLVVGIAIIFGGFLLTSTPRPLPAPEPWYPPNGRRHPPLEPRAPQHATHP